MYRARAVLMVVVLAVLAASAWGIDVKTVVVPVSGTFRDGNLGGWINYSGEVTLLWTPTTESGQTVWNLASTLVAQAWCINTGAGYMLYSACSGCCPGLTGETVEMCKPVLAVGYETRPIEAQVTVAFALPDAAQPPVLASLAFAGR